MPHRPSFLSVLLSALLLAACAGIAAPPQEAAVGKPAEPKRVVLKVSKQQVVEVAFSSVKEGKLGQLMGDYFPKVMPLAAEYGGSLLASFGVEKAAGPIQPQMGALFAWPSVDSFVRITKDARLHALIPIRNDALAYINEANFFTVDGDAEVALDPGRSYELVAVSQAQAASQLRSGGALLVLRPTKESIGSFRPEALVLREAESDVPAAPDAVRLRIRFNPPAR